MGLIRLDPYGDENGNLDYRIYIDNVYRETIPAANLATMIHRLIAKNYRLITVTQTIWPGVIGYSFDDIESIIPGFLDF